MLKIVLGRGGEQKEIEYERAKELSLFTSYTGLFRESRVFGNLLNAYLILKGVNQRALAKSISVSPSAVSHWLSGRRIPDASAVYWIVKALHLDDEETEYLLRAQSVDIVLRQVDSYMVVAFEQHDIESIANLLPKVLARSEGAVNQAKKIIEFLNGKMERFKGCELVVDEKVKDPPKGWKEIVV